MPDATPPTPDASPRRGRAWWVGTLLLLAAAAAGVALWQLRTEPAEPPPVALVFGPHDVARAGFEPMAQTIEFSGPLVAPHTAVVRSRAAGTLVALEVAEGHRVHAGQVLGRLDLADLNSRVDDRRAALEAAMATLAEAKQHLDSQRRLATQGFISSNALQSAEARHDAAAAQWRSAQAQLATTRIGVRDAALVAPIDGIVGKRHVLPGEMLAPEQAVVTIVDLSRLELAGSVGTHEVSLLAVGQTVEVRVEGLSTPRAGRIDRIAPAAEAAARAIGVTVTLDNPGERLRAGQYAVAWLRLDDPAPRLTVPIGALTQVSGQDQLWTIESGVLVRRLVVTGRRDPMRDRVELVSGAAPGLTVLAQRFDNLREGAPAVLREGSASGPASGVAPGPPPAVQPAAASAPARF